MDSDPRNLSEDGVVRQFLRHAWAYKYLWITPIVLVVSLMVLLLFAGHSHAPFRYTLF